LSILFAVIYGIGIDIINIDRIQKALDRWGQRMLNRIYSSKEREECLSKKNVLQSLAGKFAAKEAFLKALGTGIAQGMSWKQIEVLDDKSGQPQLIVAQDLKYLMSTLGIKDCFISISHEKKYAVAQAILVKAG
jgi:holo-[acyl-carrier protein] synthase